MLIQFDPKKLTFRKVKFKRVTTALGGSINILDEDYFAKTGREIFHRYECPLAVARLFVLKHGLSKFMYPAEGAITVYDQRIVALELAPKAQNNQRIVEGLHGDREWITQSEINWMEIIHPDMNENKWYFDGVYAYKFPKDDHKKLINDSDTLSSDGKFRNIRCEALNLTRLAAGSEAWAPKKKRKRESSVDDLPQIEKRSCLGFIVDSDRFVISPPIWKDLQGVHDRRIKGKDIDESEDGVFDTSAVFNTLDDKLFVNLQFALAAGKEIAQAFGYDSIAPLQLPKMMIQLKTVNLPRVVKEIKNTHDIGMKFTHGLAWLLGLQYRATTIERLGAIRRMLKYLTTKGIYRRASLENQNVRHATTHTETVPVISFGQAVMNVDNMKGDEWKEIIQQIAHKRRSIDALSFDGVEEVV
jgi:hypothetical protein